MKYLIQLRLDILILVCILTTSLATAQGSDKIMIIIIDGARYSETFGDPAHTYIPKMWELSSEGTVIDDFQNDHITYTSRAIPALWCGAWTEVRDTFYAGQQTQYTIKPSIFEYYRKQKNMPAEECFYILKYIEGLWLPSFHPDYGPDYWPQFHSVGLTDDDVAEQAELVMDMHHPHFLLVYLADVDHAGHSGNWQDYTNAIQKADSIVGFLWGKLQTDPFYQNSTTMFVTNDHGRHDDQNGGFSGHGDGCDGCRHIQFLALGPAIKKNFVSTEYRKIPDMAVTAAEILGLDPEEATGDVMSEIFETTGVRTSSSSLHEFSLEANYPNPFNPSTKIRYNIPELSFVTLKVYDGLGNEMATLVNEKKPAGSYEVEFSVGQNSILSTSSGIYFYQLRAGSFIQTRKMILMK
ncbi:T9SS type A sorting domain-containing protein [Bacteroidota bacterium]